MKALRIGLILVWALGFAAVWPWSIAEATTNYLYMRPVPTATPTPSGDPRNRRIWCWDGVTYPGSGDTASVNALCVGTANTIHVAGVSDNLPWWKYETADGTYDENYFTTLKAAIDTSQYYALYLQNGPGTFPIWLLNDLSDNQSFTFTKSTTNAGTPVAACATGVFPLFVDSTFTTKWEDMILHIATQYSGDTQLARWFAPPATDQLQNHIGNPWNCLNSQPNCVSGILKINGGAAGCGGSGGCCAPNYNIEAGTATPGVCGASACGNTSGGQTAYDNATVSQMETDMTYQAAAMAGQSDGFKYMFAISGENFPAISNTNGTNSFDTTILSTLVPQVQNIFGSSSYIFNEALGDGSPGGYTSYMNIQNHWCGYINPVTGVPFQCVAQMVAQLSVPLKITQVAGNGTYATVSYTCTASTHGFNDCVTPIGIQAGDSVTLNETGDTSYNGTFTVLASPAPNNTVSPFTFAFASISHSTVNPTANNPQVVDSSRQTSNCVSLANAYTNANALNVLFIETYLQDIQSCPVTNAAQWAVMPSS